MAYYQRIRPSIKLLEGYEDVIAAAEAFELKQRHKDAFLAREVLAEMWARYRRLEVEAPREATRVIRRRIRQTAVRPRTSGRLEAGISARAIPTRFPAAGLAVVDLDYLAANATNPEYPKAGTYWRAQEYGTSAHVGRVIPGYFQPGRSRPAAAEFRNHPYFQQAGKGRRGKAAKGTPAMVITKPIQARHFLQDGMTEVADWHRAERAKINSTAIRKLARI